MSLSRPVQPRGNNVNGDSANTFPLLALPPELKTQIFSFLGPKDRLNARVCKELDAIEAQLKPRYYVTKLKIQTHTHYGHILNNYRCGSYKDTICLREDQSHSIDGIRRITQNASIGTLRIYFGNSEELDRALYDILNDSKVDELILCVQNSQTVRMLMKNSFIGHMPSSCKSLEIQDWYDMSAEALHEMYEAMMKNATKIRKFTTNKYELCYSFLPLIGISVEGDDIHSRRDIEAYKIVDRVGVCLGHDYEYYKFHIFDGSLEICFIQIEESLKFILHETRESLEAAKGKLMSLSRPAQPRGNDRKRKVNGDFANNTFPLLALPPKLKSRIFSFLGPKDRLNARVCKELDAIEAKSKYYVEGLTIATWTHRIHSGRSRSCKDLKNTICLREDQPRAIDGIGRITQNASFRALRICFSGTWEIDRALYYLIKDFKVDKLVIYVQELSYTANKLMKDSFIGHMPSSCKWLEILRCIDMSAEAVHEVYEAMINGTTNIRKFSTTGQAPSVLYDSFLALIGISIEDDAIHSRRDIEAYEITPKMAKSMMLKLIEDGDNEDDESDDICIFDGNLEMLIRLYDDDDDDDLLPISSAYLQFKLHETRESLEEAKGKLVDYKVDVIRDPQ